MKKVWMRVGMTVEVTDEEYEELKGEASKGTKAFGYGVYNDIDVPDWLIKKTQKEGEIDGDSYIPANYWTDYQ